MKQALASALTAATLLVAVGPPATAQGIALPDMGDFSQQYVSARDEERLGLNVVRRLWEDGMILHDVQLEAYLNSVGQRLALHAEQHGHRYTFFLVNDPAINAFAAPGGFIGVHSGLLLATRSEDELAGVLAHEVAHVSQRHIARAVADAQRRGLPMAAAMLAAVLVSAASPQAGQAALAGTMAAQAQHAINFTRTHEQEADRVGSQLLTRAGFDPDGMVSFFRHLERRGGGRGAVPEFLLTHPLPSSRVSDIEGRVEGAGLTSTRDQDAYRLARARLRVLVNDNTTELVRDFESRLAARDHADEAAERYGYALALRRAGRLEEAATQVEWLLARAPDRLAYRIEAAELALARGRRERAWALFEEAEALYTGDRALAVHHAQALATEGDPVRARSLLRPHLGRHITDAPLHALHAQVASRAGDRAGSHAALAEYHYLIGDLSMAIRQAELGLRVPEATPYQQAQIQARLRQWREELEETRG